MVSVVPFEDDPASGPAVRGFLHEPATLSGDGLVLAHGAGSSAGSPLLVGLADTFARSGFLVLRCDLPYRQERPSGPPSPATAPRDRAGLRSAAQALRRRAWRRLVLGGHSYGGRQASMLAAEEPKTAEALLLLSYPLHPPRRPRPHRTAHFPTLRTPALFVHGSRDPFGSLEDLRTAIGVIPAPTELLAVDGAGHDLAAGRGRRAGGRPEIGAIVLAALSALLAEALA